MQETEVATPDGRRLRAEIHGDGRRVVLVQVGTPNAGVLFDRWVQDAAVRGLTLVTYDRPGYGASSAQPGRAVADCAADVRAIADALSFDRCAVWGFSGGGPHALACGALLPDLVVAVAAIGSLAPFDAPGFDFFEGYPDDYREDHELYLSDRAKWDRENEEQREDVLAKNAEELADEWSATASPGDRELLHGEVGLWLHQAVQAALAPGDEGWTGDHIAMRSPWGFDPASIQLPTKIWHGHDDTFVPIQHGRWLATHIPDAETDLRPEDGHFRVVAERISEVHTWLEAHL